MMLLLKVPVQVAMPVVGSGFGCAGVQVCASVGSDTPSDEDTSEKPRFSTLRSAGTACVPPLPARRVRRSQLHRRPDTLNTRVIRAFGTPVSVPEQGRVVFSKSVAKTPYDYPPA